MEPQEPKPEQYRNRDQRAALEPSTFIRYFSVLSSQITGDFNFDFVRTMIAFFPIWISEGKDQEQIHERYISATMFIMSSLWPSVSKEYGTDRATEFDVEYQKIDSEMNACNIVEVYTKSTDDPTAKGDMEIVWGASLKDECADKNKMVEVRESKKTIFCKKEFYDQGLHCARENGYSRVNCGARGLFYRAMKMAAEKEMMDPEKSVVHINGPGVSQKGTDDYLTKTKKQLGG